MKPTEEVEDGDIRILQETPNIEQNINIPQLELLDRPPVNESARNTSIKQIKMQVNIDSCKN